jgi:hypothetical protein
MPSSEKKKAKLSSDLCVMGQDRLSEGGNRPYLELEATEHPLSQDFHNGLTIARAQEIAEHAMHEFEKSEE